jgi:cell division protein FtsB
LKLSKLLLLILKAREGSPIIKQNPLQQILGTDKRNPVLSLFQNHQTNQLHVYYGAELLEIVPNDREHISYKFLVARLYNAKVKVSALQETFGVDRKTMKKWGEALRTGDNGHITKTFAGRQAKRKLTPEVQYYVRMRFPAIYKETQYDYSQRMRHEIEHVFGCSLTGETLRPLLQELITEIKEKKRETSCECPEADPADEGLNSEAAGSNEEEFIPAESDNRKTSPPSEPVVWEVVALCHHVGVLLFSGLFSRLDAWMGEDSWLLKQWLASILLGAINIEQTKLLDFDDLTKLLGKCTRSLNEQRSHLSQLAHQDVVQQILRLNAVEVDAASGSDFYYDPHTKRYTGIQKLLKGWCPSVRLADKALHLDFIHTAAGHPVYLKPTDNYNDLRERFFRRVQEFRDLLQLEENQVITVIVDRGIYSYDVFQEVIADPNLHVITWEKNYKSGEWNKDSSLQTFILERSRNHEADLQKYTFDYYEESWKKDPRMRRFQVQATNPKGKSIQLGILTDDLERPAQDVIALMFRRWIQENDFKYLDKHFGMKEITSYAVIAYKQFQDHMQDKQMKSGAYKALEMTRREIKEKLKTLLLREHQNPEANAKRQNEIQSLSSRLEDIEEEMKTTEKEMSRLEFLIEQDYVRLDARNKYLMDALKVLARNAFYNMLEPFKKEYDNYRDDHSLFRSLTHSDGILNEQEHSVEVILLPKPNYPPKVRRIMEAYLENLNATQLCMPDGTGRPLTFRIGKKKEFEIAIVSE